MILKYIWQKYKYIIVTTCGFGFGGLLWSWDICRSRGIEFSYNIFRAEGLITILWIGGILPVILTIMTIARINIKKILLNGILGIISVFTGFLIIEIIKTEIDPYNIFSRILSPLNILEGFGIISLDQIDNLRPIFYTLSNCCLYFIIFGAWISFFYALFLKKRIWPILWRGALGSGVAIFIANFAYKFIRSDYQSRFLESAFLLVVFGIIFGFFLGWGLIKSNFPKKKLILSKRRKLYLVILLFVSIIAGTLLWREYWNTPWEWYARKDIYGDYKNFVIENIDGNNIVRNKEAGIEFNILNGWETGIWPTDYPSNFSLLTSDAKESVQTQIFMNKGCRITPEINYLKVTIPYMKGKIEQNIFSSQIISKNLEETEVDGYKSLKIIKEIDIESINPDLENIYMIGIFIPTKKIFAKNKLFSFTLESLLEEKERCSQEFDKFLETVKIK